MEEQTIWWYLFWKINQLTNLENSKNNHNYETV